MKKIVPAAFFALYILFGTSFAQVDFSEAIGTTSMPSDIEIRRAIQNLGFSGEQEEEIFKLTKQKLRAMYSNPDVSEANEELNKNIQLLQSGALDKYIDPSIKTELLRDLSNIPSVNKGSVEEVNYEQETSSSSNAQKGYNSTKKGFEHKGFESHRRN